MITDWQNAQPLSFSGGSGAWPTPFQAAAAYVRHGLSLIPILANGSKAPAYPVLPRVWSDARGRYVRSWRGYQHARPTQAELWHWYRWYGYGLAILGGAVSGGLEVIDCDSWEVAVAWLELVRATAPHLLARLVLVRTPRPGLHAYYRCVAFGRCCKLARVPDPEQDSLKPRTIIEVKGEGGYCLAPPSPAFCHPTGRPYEYAGGLDLTRVPTITPAEREILLACAGQLNRWQGPPRQHCPSRPGRPGGEDRPGDDFNETAEWATILQPHGWQWVDTAAGGGDYWCRPGKTDGVSATSDFADSDLLFVYSTNAHPFDGWKAYSKFRAYVLLNHGGDIRAATRALARQGYGRPRYVCRSLCDPYAHYAGYQVRSLRPPAGP